MNKSKWKIHKRGYFNTVYIIRYWCNCKTAGLPTINGKLPRLYELLLIGETELKYYNLTYKELDNHVTTR